MTMMQLFKIEETQTATYARLLAGEVVQTMSGKVQIHAGE